MPEMTPAEQRARQYRELAATIADQAQAIADGTLAGPRYGMARLILRNAETLDAWTPDDRSGMPVTRLDEGVRREAGVQQDTMDTVSEWAHRWVRGKHAHLAHAFEFGPGGSPYCDVCGCTADGFHHSGSPAPAPGALPRRSAQASR